MTAPKLTDIEQATKRYADERDKLVLRVEALESATHKARSFYFPGIKQHLARAAEAATELRALIEASPELFESPRTQLFHGIKVGYRKGTGGVTWEDDAQVIKLIEKHFAPAQAELLIKTTKRPIAKAIADLDVSDLKKIGCTVEATGDVVVIKPVDGEVEKTVNALLKDATETES